MSDFLFVDTKKKMRELTSWLASSLSRFKPDAHNADRWRAFAFDTETYVPGDKSKGLKKEALILDKARMMFCSLAHRDRAYAIPTADYDPKYLPTDYVIQELKPFMRDKTVRKIMHHANYDVNVIANHGVMMRNIYCTMLAGACWDETIPNGLKERCILVGHRLKKTKTVDFTDINALAKYAAMDAVVALALHNAYEFGHAVVIGGKDRNMLLKGKRRYFFDELERKILPIVIRIERRGVLLDVNQLAQIDKKIDAAMKIVLEKIYTANGEPFNVGSPPQLAKFLFEKLGLTPYKYSEKTKKPSTDKISLANIRRDHPIVKQIVKHSQLKGLRKYTCTRTGLHNYCDAYNRIHATFSQLGARTTRFSISNPALQQIPSKMDLFSIRNCFRAPKGKVLIVGDKDQVELRLMANYTLDRMMLRSYKKGISIHFQTGVECGLIPKNALSPTITPEEKDAIKKSRGYGVSKNCNFGLMYEGTAYTLQRQLVLEGIDITIEECKDIVDKYWQVYAGVPLYREQLYEDVRRTGVVTNICGRPYRILGINSDRWAEKSAAQRQAINTRIQGSAAECLKWIMFFAENDAELRDLEIKMLLQVHDELMFECPEKHAVQGTKAVKRVMEMPPPNLEIPLAVPLPAAVGFGPTWSTAKH